MFESGSEGHYYRFQKVMKWGLGKDMSEVKYSLNVQKITTILC